MVELVDTGDFDDMRVLGPYQDRKDKRLRVVLIHDNGRTQTLSYPRFVMESYLGVTLDPNEDVHHIDGNVENNDISNLEVVWHKDHCKEHSLKYKEPILVNCFYCGSEFELSTARQSQRNRDIKRGKQGPFCSRRCSGKYGADVQKSNKVGIL